VLSLRKEVDLLGELDAGYGVASVGLFSVRRWLVWLVVSLPLVVTLVWVAERFGWATNVPLMTGVLFAALVIVGVMVRPVDSIVVRRDGVEFRRLSVRGLIREVVTAPRSVSVVESWWRSTVRVVDGAGSVREVRAFALSVVLYGGGRSLVPAYLRSCGLGVLRVGPSR
jgi:hypothetical protein